MIIRFLLVALLFLSLPQFVYAEAMMEFSGTGFTMDYCIVNAYGGVYDGIQIEAGATGGKLRNVVVANGQTGLNVDESVSLTNVISAENDSDDINIAAGKTVTALTNFFNDAAKVGDGTYSGTGTWSTDPLFIDAANANFRVGRNSAAIDAGTDWGQTQDIVGNGQHGSAWDIGAYEYVRRVRRIPGFLWF